MPTRTRTTRTTRRRRRKPARPRLCPICHAPADRRTARPVEVFCGWHWHRSCLAALVTLEAYAMAQRHQTPAPIAPGLLRDYFTFAPAE